MNSINKTFCKLNSITKTCNPIREFVSGPKLKTLQHDVVEISDTIRQKAKSLPKTIPFKIKGAFVSLTERGANNSAVDPKLLAQIRGYTDSKGNILPYLFIEGISVEEKGKGMGKDIMEKIIKIAKENYGGRLVLKPENKDCNPTPFYVKCGLTSMTEKGKKEIEDFFLRGKLFESGNSDPMYLPI